MAPAQAVESMDALGLIRARALPRGAELLLESEFAGIDRAAYVSTPMTSGFHFVDAMRRNRGGLDKAALYAIFLENRASARKLEEKLEGTYESVVNPYILDSQRGWIQADYHRFWVEILRTCVADSFFVDKWEYSTGCVVEFAESVRLGLGTFDSGLNAISIDEGLKRLEQAINFLDAADVPTAVHRAARLQLRSGQPSACGWNFVTGVNPIAAVGK